MKTSSTDCYGCRPRAAEFTASDKQLHEAETRFLQERLRDLQTNLEEQLTDLAVSTDQDSLPEGQFELLATRQRKSEILQELLQTRERDRHLLECLMEKRLCRIHHQLGGLEHTVEDRQAYDEAHWQLEHEYQVLKGILEDWQGWLRGAALE